MIRRAGAHGAAVHPGRRGRAAAARRRRSEASARACSSRRAASIRCCSSTRRSLLVHAQAGLTGLELERILAPRGLSIGDYPPVVLTSSLGGIIAVRTPGKSSARHGFFEDAVVGVSAVLADGRTVHTRVAPRRATGPDLARALCGSEGTIGFITSAVLRIHAQARGAPRRRVRAARRSMPRSRAVLPRAARGGRAVGPAHLRRRRGRAPLRRPRAAAGPRAAVRRHRRPDRSRGVRSRSDHERRARRGRRDRPTPRSPTCGGAACTPASRRPAPRRRCR